MAPAAAAKPAARTTVNVAGAVYRVQLSLLDGAASSNEPFLHASAAILSSADYDDVVTERSIAEVCGNPACASPLPDAANPKAAPRFHISLREHRVYDLEEARKFCSERCLVASAAFAASLPPDRPFGIPPDRLDALVALFEGSGDGPGLGFRADGGKKEDEGRKVEIREKETPGPGEVTLQEWIGPSGAIEGYVPRHHPIHEGPMPQAKQGKASRAELSGNKNVDSGTAVPGEHSMAVSSSSVEVQVGLEAIAKKFDDMVLCENAKTKKKEADKTPSKIFKQDEDNEDKTPSAVACAAALIEAAGAISSGTSEVEDAVSKAGIIILPDMLHQKQFENVHDKDAEEKEVFETDSDVVKWPTKTVLLDTDMFEVDDSWHEKPPEGFSLTLSAFATMWATIFGWVSRSSLAYVYMLDDSSIEELLISNGREYPEKRVSQDSQSSEIKRALASCISNALPVLVSNMRMQIPVSKLETTLGYLIETMSLVDALPALRSRQWQLLVLVLLDALSMHRLPALTPVISDSKLVHKVLNSAQVSREEYDSMVDLILPFGRSTQTPPPSAREVQRTGRRRNNPLPLTST